MYSTNVCVTLLNLISQFRHICCVRTIYCKVKKITLNTSRTQWNTHIFYSRIKKNKNEMGETCGMYGGRKIIQGFGGETSWK